MIDFYDIPGYVNFIREAHKLLIDTLSEFFSVEVRLHFKPTTELQYYGIDITEDSERTVYPVDQNTVLIVSHATYNDEAYYLGIKFIANHIGEETKIFNVTAKAISACLNQCVYSQFRNAISYMGDRLVLRLIAKQLEPGGYSASKIMHVIDKFVALRSTTFEGKHFSTGLVLTRSFHDYKHQGEEGRMGELLSLNRSKNYLSRVDNRFWYMVDGFRTFYMTDLKSDIRNMFVYLGTDADHFKNMVLYKTLKGGDALIRTEAGRDVSVITSDGIEFINQENCWRYRDYELLKKRVVKALPLSDEVYTSLLYYVLYCSKNDISSLIWIPANIVRFPESLKAETINKLANSEISICNQAYSSLLKRILSSDGATVIDSNGSVKAFGCMVETKDARPSGVKGTGETAAGLLAKNGIAIKVSQDGTIKVFLNGRDKPMKF